MTMTFRVAAIIAPAALAIASCSQAQTGDSSATAGNLVTKPVSEIPAADAFTITEVAKFSQPWAMAFEPGTGNIFVTEKTGGFKMLTPAGVVSDVGGAPQVAVGGQGGLGQIVFAPDYATSRTVYLSWAQAAEGEARRAVVGRGKMACGESCAVEGLEVIWRQEPAINSPGHFSHRIAFSPDGKYMFVASGERMQGTPAQELDNNLGKVLRLMPDGTPAPGNPFADRGGVSAEIWSYGHRNLAGLRFDGDGKLWDIEHGPAGGDEINLVKPGQNYGWPVRSNGNDYGGTVIPDHTADDGFTKPAISWNPVIAPGDFIFYSGSLFPDWKGNALAAAMGSAQSIVRVSFDGEAAKEEARYTFGTRLREIAQGPDGAIWVLADAADGRLLKLTPKD
jgi:glucose/arabinose dehydrogenase